MSGTHRLFIAVTITMLLVSIASAEVVGYWPFDGGEGMLAFDHAPAGNDALLIGAQWADGREGGGLQFGGLESDQYMLIPHDDALRLQPPFTLQFAWLPGGGGTRIFFRKGRPGDRFTAYAYAEGALHFMVRQADGEITRVQCPLPGDDVWHDLAFVCGDGALSIIIDGEVRASTPMTAETLFADTSPLLIGTYSPGYRYPLAGTLDDLCVSNAALGPDQLDAEIARARVLEPPVTRAQQLPSPDGGLTLARDGVPGATIVIAQDATPLQLEPALELRSYVAEMTGARLPLAYDTDPPDGPVVLVGESALTRDLGLPADLSGDEYVIRCEPGRLVLAGHDALLPTRCAASAAPRTRSSRSCTTSAACAS